MQVSQPPQQTVKSCRDNVPAVGLAGRCSVAKTTIFCNCCLALVCWERRQCTPWKWKMSFLKCLRSCQYSFNCMQCVGRECLRAILQDRRKNQDCAESKATRGALQQYDTLSHLTSISRFKSFIGPCHLSGATIQSLLVMHLVTDAAKISGFILSYDWCCILLQPSNVVNVHNLISELTCIFRRIFLDQITHSDYIFYCVTSVGYFQTNACLLCSTFISTKPIVHATRQADKRKGVPT